MRPEHRVDRALVQPLLTLKKSQSRKSACHNNIGGILSITRKSWRWEGASLLAPLPLVLGISHTNSTRSMRLRYFRSLLASTSILHPHDLRQKQANIHGLEQWMKEAQARTDAYDQGSSEVAWILNRGPSIPYKAIEGGRDESGEIIYIARACVEVRSLVLR